MAAEGRMSETMRINSLPVEQMLLFRAQVICKKFESRSGRIGPGTSAALFLESSSSCPCSERAFMLNELFINFNTHLMQQPLFLKKYRVVQMQILKTQW